MPQLLLRYVPLVGATTLPINLCAESSVNMELTSAVDCPGLHEGKFCPNQPGKPCQETKFFREVNGQRRVAV